MLRNGFRPEEMEDKWFVFHEKDWLYFHRSWTGFLVFWLKLENTEPGTRVVEVWASRDRTQYRSNGADEDAKMLKGLLEYLLRHGRA